MVPVLPVTTTVANDPNFKIAGAVPVVPEVLATTFAVKSLLAFAASARLAAVLMVSESEQLVEL